MRLAVITPCRNEAAYLPITIRCMLAQKTKPDVWVIANDGSSDSTPDIVRKALPQASFIRLVNVPDRGKRLPGAGVIDTFYTGLHSVGIDNFDIIAKFDADLEFPDHFIQTIKEAFVRSPKLGVAGGILLEQSRPNGPFEPEVVPDDFVGGPNKFYRRECLEDIGGLIRRAGWDGVDMIRANMKGWSCQRIPGLYLKHLRVMGSAKGEGLQNAFRKYGDVSYYMGGYFWYFLLRVTGRSLQVRSLSLGVHMLMGYFYGMKKKEREVPEFRSFLKKKQIANMTYWLNRLLSSKQRSTQPGQAGT